MTTGRIEDLIKAQRQNAKSGDRITRTLSGRIRAQEQQTIVEQIKKRPGYRISRSKILNAASDPYSKDIVITQVKERYRGQKNETLLDFKQIRDEYQVALNDTSIPNPFVISTELVRIIRSYTRDLSGEEPKARAIFDWIEENIDYGDSKKTHNYRNTQEVLKHREGVCGEMAFLYVTMARSLNLRSSYVSVSRDCFGKEVHHACAAVDIGIKDILADPAYHQFNIRHKEFQVLSDLQVLERFAQWR
jgi:transglutaminase-like putative cysteine protease